MFLESFNVFEETIDSLLEHKTNLLTFPCESHKNEILTFIIPYYLPMRMGQYLQMTNQKEIKVSSKKKKLSKNFKNIILNEIVPIFFLYTFYLQLKPLKTNKVPIITYKL